MKYKIHPFHVDKIKVTHNAHAVVHVVYLTLCFIESHGYYGIAAGCLSLIVIVQEAMERHTEYEHAKGRLHSKAASTAQEESSNA